MAHSLEARSPFLDQDIVQFAASLPEAYKRRGNAGKLVLKRACADLLPEDIQTRPKQGFGVPIGQWFRRELRELVCDALLDPRARGRGLFRIEAIRALLAEHQQGRHDHSSRLWALLVFELWQRQFTDQPRPARST